MKQLFLFLFLIFNLQTFAQKKADNIIVITTDGFRWQEMFGGVDTTLANSRIFNEDGQAYIDEKFGDANALESRKNYCLLFGIQLLKKDKFTGTGILIIK